MPNRPTSPEAATIQLPGPGERHATGGQHAADGDGRNRGEKLPESTAPPTDPGSTLTSPRNFCP